MSSLDESAENPAPLAAPDEGIRVRGLAKRFGNVTALAGIDLDVGPGEIVSVLGPNGAGKSTLIRVLGTTVVPDRGEVSVAGSSALDEPALARRQIGLSIGEERSLYWRLSGRQNLAFFGALHGLGRVTSRHRADELLAAVGLADGAGRPVRGYSSGMRARLALARAMISDPPVLLLDEPTRSLDPLAASQFREAALGMAADRRAAILIATHDLHEAVAISDRVVVLAAGKVRFAQSTQGLDAPALERAFLAAVVESERSP